MPKTTGKTAKKVKDLPFEYDRDWKSLDVRQNPKLYRIGKGEQGVLMVQPYKSEILPHWKFATPAAATASSQKLFSMYEEYKSASDFIGMDMTRKFVQMGVTRSRRYANHRGGKKYSGEIDGKGKKVQLPKAEVEDPDKAESARIFAQVLSQIKEDPVYIEMTDDWRRREHERGFSPDR